VSVDTSSTEAAATRSRYDIARDCVHCGLCLQVCPTYVHLGGEADSPRGRIYLMRAHDEGRQEVTAALQEHLDLCLVCRACETACPSGVQFGSMIEEFRAQLRPSWPAPTTLRARLRRALGRWALVQLLPKPSRLRMVVALLRAYQASGVAALARRSGLLRALRLEETEALAPRVAPASERRAPPPLLLAHGRRRARVLWLRGCVAPELVPEAQQASIEALRHNGCEVVTPPGQTCCGALHFHTGFHAEGMALLERNLRAFDPRDADAIVVNAAGCGSTLKEYARLGHEVDGDAAQPARFAAAVRDISEFLDDLGLEPPRRSVRARVAYDEPCHLLHGQRVSAAPKRILSAIPGVTGVPLQHADRCCGSAGIYNVQQPRLAGEILDEKIRCIAESGADTVATGNPGCILQIRTGLRRAAVANPGLAGIRVVHPMQLLAASYTT
jgi:glycolate oxidase iron-sulfur subunit